MIIRQRKTRTFGCLGAKLRCWFHLLWFLSCYSISRTNTPADAGHVDLLPESVGLPAQKSRGSVRPLGFPERVFEVSNLATSPQWRADHLKLTFLCTAGSRDVQ